MTTRRYERRRARKSVLVEGSAFSKPATTNLELLEAFKTLTVLMMREMSQQTPLSITLAHCLSLLIKEGFRAMGIPMEYKAWLHDPNRDNNELLPLLGRCWSAPGYPEETGAYWPPPKMNAFEARLWPEQIAALKQHALSVDDRTVAHTCVDLAIFLETFYQHRIQAGLQRNRKAPSPPH